MGPNGRTTAARIAAPVAFLLAVTIAVLLVREALRDEAAPAGGAGVVAVTTGGPAAVRFHRIARGETLGSIAARYGTTVDELERLNPRIDPVGLEVGVRIRVR